MVRLSEALRAVPAQLTKHEYSYEDFGSWWTVLRIGGERWRLTFDRRERRLGLQRGTFSTAIPSWGEDVWSHSMAATDPSVSEIVEAIRKHAT